LRELLRRWYGGSRLHQICTKKRELRGYLEAIGHGKSRKVPRSGILLSSKITSFANWKLGNQVRGFPLCAYLIFYFFLSIMRDCDACA